MKFTDVVVPSEVQSVFNSFPQVVTDAFRDPFLKKNAESGAVPTQARMYAGVVVLSALSIVVSALGIFASGAYLYNPLAAFVMFLTGVVIAPLWIVASALLGYVIAMMLGFKKDFANYAGLLLAELPLFALYLGLSVVARVGSYSGKELLGLAVNALFGGWLTFRFLRLCQISDKRIKAVLAVLAVVALVGLSQVAFSLI